MDINVTKLISISSDAIGCNPPILNGEKIGLMGDLNEILTVKNGFYAFESALHFFPACVSGEFMALEQWNFPELWRSSYESIPENSIFFAEDIFGCQFLILNDRIHSFDPETGEIEEIANNFDEWAKSILKDYNFWTGFSLAHEWQVIHGSIPEGDRLLPKIPFVLGGEFSVGNLYQLNAVEGMKVRGDLSRQIKNLEDGTKIRIKVVG
jgi:hypothetical protein